MDQNARSKAGHDAPDPAPGAAPEDAPDTSARSTSSTASSSTEGDVHTTCQTVAAMLMATYEELDRLERLLSGAATSYTTDCAQPSPPTRAALVAALQVIDIINGNLHGRDFAEFAVLERVLGNLRAVMGTVAGLLCDLTLPGAPGGEDLVAVTDQARAALDAFSMDPAAEVTPAAPR